MLHAIENTKINYEGEAWDKISPEGKDIVKKMLSKDKDARISASDALEHDWFTLFEKDDLGADADNAVDHEII